LLPQLKQELGAYHIYPTETFSQAHPETFFNACDRLLEMRTRAALWLMDRYDWEFLIAVFFDTDRILHQTWHFLDPTHPWHSGPPGQDNSAPVRRYFQRLDESVSRLLEKAGDDTLVIIMSDHGMGAAHNFVVLNNWLLSVGLLQLKQNIPTRLKHQMFNAGFTLKNVHRIVDRLGLAKHAEYKALYSADGLLKQFFLSFLNVDWSRSKAYSFGRHTGPIYINLKGREPGGIVAPGEEYEAVRREIIALARDFRDPRTGRPIIGQILRREEVYNGPHFDEAPDLTLLPTQETDIFFGLADFGDNHIMAPVYCYSGMHRDYGLLIMNGSGVKPGAIEGAAIVDLAPTILWALGQPIPGDMDGVPLTGHFQPDRLEHPPTYTGDAATETPLQGPDFTAQEEQEIEDRLRDLGYLG
ncbi:MAG: alkaline phosphatase family protein, partial [Anaerolineae bacterium]